MLWKVLLLCSILWKTLPQNRRVPRGPRAEKDGKIKPWPARNTIHELNIAFRPISTRLHASLTMGARILIEQLHFSESMEESSPSFALQWAHAIVLQPNFVLPPKQILKMSVCYITRTSMFLLLTALKTTTKLNDMRCTPKGGASKTHLCIPRIFLSKPCRQWWVGTRNILVQVLRPNVSRANGASNLEGGEKLLPSPLEIEEKYPCFLMKSESSLTKASLRLFWRYYTHSICAWDSETMKDLFNENSEKKHTHTPIQ